MSLAVINFTDKLEENKKPYSNSYLFHAIVAAGEKIGILNMRKFFWINLFGFVAFDYWMHNG